MAEVTYTVCDVCAPGESPVSLAGRHQGKGWVLGDKEYAIEQFGWQLLMKGSSWIMCAECAEELAPAEPTDA